MPFKSESQRRFLWAEHPDIAKRWAGEYPGQHDLPKHVGDTMDGHGGEKMHPALRALHSFFSALDEHTKGQMSKGGAAEDKLDHGADEASEGDEHSKAVMGHVMASNLPTSADHGDADEAMEPTNEEDSPVQSMLHRLRHREPFQDHLGYTPGGDHRGPAKQSSGGMPKPFAGKGGKRK